MTIENTLWKNFEIKAKTVGLQSFLLLFLFTALIPVTLKAQKLIARQGGDSPTFHTSLEEAITQANDGDTLYIPGGYFEISTPLSKKLHFVGEGHNPSASSANGVTYINGTFTIQQEASGSSFHGLYVTPIITFNDGVNLILIERCNIAALNGGWGLNSTFNEVVFRVELNISLRSCQFHSCIFNSAIYGNYTNCNFKNSIFLYNAFPWRLQSYYGGSPIGLVYYGNFENNIFYTSDGIQNVTSSVFKNNLFVCEQTFDGTNLIGSNNIVGQLPESIFVNHTGNLFLYESDFHLKATSPGKNVGTDGKDIGIYGGPSPWKDGSVPFNPHVEFKKVEGYTDATGNLKVEIRVKSQER